MRVSESNRVTSLDFDGNVVLSKHIQENLPVNTHFVVMIRYRNESLLLIDMHNSYYSNCNLDTERVTGIVDNSHKERREESKDGESETESNIAGERRRYFYSGAIYRTWSDVII